MNLETYNKAMRTLIFDPLDMHNTTFSFQEAYEIGLLSLHAMNAHEEIVVLKQTATTGFNHRVVPYRPAGAAWSTSADMIKYVYNELSGDVAPDGTRLFAGQPLLKRRAPLVKAGANESYLRKQVGRFESDKEIFKKVSAAAPCLILISDSMKHYPKSKN